MDEAGIRRSVRLALEEDLGPGDLTAELVPAGTRAAARVLCREAAVLCGQAWFEEVFRQLDPGVSIRWHRQDGEPLAADTLVCELQGLARPLLSGERTALNFLQTLSGTATEARRYAEAVAGTGARVLDTRKTLPGLREAQKYAVRCGGCHNHRMGLYDAVLVKENHIRAAGSLGAALARVRDRIPPGTPVEVEVESLEQLREALDAGARHLLLDNFGLEQIRKAVSLAAGRARLEVSGGVCLDNIHDIARTGVDAISVGALTKHVHAVDLSMRFTEITAP